MDFEYTGLFIAVLILLGMLITCHLSNYFDSRSRSKQSRQSKFINLTVPSGAPPMIYNKISYSGEQMRIPCEIAEQANVPCSQLQSPCPTIMDANSQLSDSEMAILYKIAYEQSGLELMKRILANENKK
jgi:hypothetical protein